jgi:endonuclease/exonuclease/phosphatase family metal-dependent hydrolase
VRRGQRSCLILIGAMLATFAVPAGHAFGLRVATYNILNYSASALREGHFRTIFAEIQPDILVVQEILSQSAVNRLLSQVLNHADGPPGTYAAATFVNGTDTDNALFYRTDVVTFTPGDHEVITTTLRDIDRWKVRPVGYDAPAAELYVYVAHLKASDGSENEQQRLAEATLMRNNANTLPAGTNFIYAGDFNLYSSDEPAYQKLITPGTDPDGQAFDPIDSPGAWHANFFFADIHTQSPRTADFGGGSTGGLDDRFDFILQSASLDDDEGMSYVFWTYRAFGQDGWHFDAAIIDPPTISEGADMATALHEGSDHLPVYLDLQVPAKVGAPASLDFGTVIVNADAVQDLPVSNAVDLLTFGYADELHYTLSVTYGFLVSSGPFQADAGAGANLHPVTMLTGARGQKHAQLNVASNDLDQPVLSVTLTGTVLSHARPSVSGSAQITVGSLDFGAAAPGEFPALTAELHNFSYDSLQALLDVYDAEFVGPDAAYFAIQGGFAPQNVGAQAAAYVVEVSPELSDVPEGHTLTADLVFSTRDQQDLLGASDLSNLVFHLTAVNQGLCGTSDIDQNGRVNLVDFATFASCHSGSGNTVPPPSCDPADFVRADIDQDGDVDLGDFSTFAFCFGT